ncbi:hypothetical protein NSQ91_17030 [Paenibacillus sp. FSL R7-0048]|uniref:hypothetical protein n=1 Tax=Paenibacillus TaxID=44249 RepID=UPI00273F4AD7|nr:hypothetical protein [Paenibacillus odorifer]
MASFAEALVIKNNISKTVLKNRRIHGIGVGYYDPKHPKKGAAVILYANAVSSTTLGFGSKLSSQIRGKTVKVPIRVVKTQKIRSNASYMDRIRPVIAGYSIGTTGGSGTVGLIVSRGNQQYLFSNNHVLTNPTNSRNRAETLQPGGSDESRTPRNRVGYLSQFITLTTSGSNRVDAALSRPLSNSIVSPQYATIGTIPGHVTSYRVGERFKKVGRTSGLTRGKVDSVNTDVQVDYGSDIGVLTFLNQSIILSNTPISLPGDSGSVWLRSSDNYAAAVNYAGTTDGKTSVAFPIDWALSALRVRVARPAGQSAGRIKIVDTHNGNAAYTRRLTAKELSRLKIIQAKSR